MFAIIGLGVVGKAYHNLYPDAVGYDLNIGNRKEVNKCDVALVCVPTPTDIEGNQQLGAIEDVMSWLETPYIIIKSTILPGTTDHLVKKHNKKIICSPEFLRKDTSNEDVKIEPIYLCGTWCKEIAAYFSHADQNRIRLIYKATTGELIKYGRNCFLASKVIFFNQMKEMCDIEGIDFEDVRKGIAEDNRIGSSHSFVNPEGGYGGNCFPKDVSAFTHKYPSLTIIKEVHEYNAKVKRSVKGSPETHI